MATCARNTFKDEERYLICSYCTCRSQIVTLARIAAVPSFLLSCCEMTTFTYALIFLVQFGYTRVVFLVFYLDSSLFPDVDKDLRKVKDKPHLKTIAGQRVSV